jgi:hypothetical protein
MRAQGNGFGITGWAIGVGWTVLVNPIMFDKLENRTYFLFAGLNLLWIPIVYFCESLKFPFVMAGMLINRFRTVYPETADRSLESIDALFSTKSPFNRSMEKAYLEQGNVLADVEKSETSVADDASYKHKGKEDAHLDRIV